MLTALAAATVAQAIIGVSSSVALVAAMLAVGSGAWGLWNIVSVTLLQELVPAQLLGRVNSVYLLFFFIGTALGATAGGLIARLGGLRAPFLIGAALLALTWFAALPQLRNRAIDAARAID